MTYYNTETSALKSRFSSRQDMSMKNNHFSSSKIAGMQQGYYMRNYSSPAAIHADADSVDLHLLAAAHNLLMQKNYNLQQASSWSSSDAAAAVLEHRSWRRQQQQQQLGSSMQITSRDDGEYNQWQQVQQLVDHTKAGCLLPYAEGGSTMSSLLAVSTSSSSPSTAATQLGHSSCGSRPGAHHHMIRPEAAAAGTMSMMMNIRDDQQLLGHRINGCNNVDNRSGAAVPFSLGSPSKISHQPAAAADGHLLHMEKLLQLHHPGSSSCWSTDLRPRGGDLTLIDPSSKLAGLAGDVELATSSTHCGLAQVSSRDGPALNAVDQQTSSFGSGGGGDQYPSSQAAHDQQPVSFLTDSPESRSARRSRSEGGQQAADNDQIISYGCNLSRTSSSTVAGVKIEGVNSGGLDVTSWANSTTVAAQQLQVRVISDDESKERLPCGTGSSKLPASLEAFEGERDKSSAGADEAAAPAGCENADPAGIGIYAISSCCHGAATSTVAPEKKRKNDVAVTAPADDSARDRGSSSLCQESTIQQQQQQQLVENDGSTKPKRLKLGNGAAAPRKTTTQDQEALQRRHIRPPAKGEAGSSCCNEVDNSDNDSISQGGGIMSMQQQEEIMQNDPARRKSLHQPLAAAAAAADLSACKQDYIHVRARRGQATDSHSLAERVRREKINERMKYLQDLVPGCSKVTGKAVMLDEIINYVQLLQRQVEILSMRLASVDHSDSLFSQSHANLPQQPPTHGFQPAGVFGANCSALDFRQISLNGNLERGLSRDDSVSTVTTQLFQESCISSHVDAAAAVTAIEAHDHEIQRLAKYSPDGDVAMHWTNFHDITRPQLLSLTSWEDEG
ncbi:hypothetical protein CY35_01G105700 [Sphagnum magellanicum]|nr:hypothetical protein CY35_01G105700 [Sphagnum magellanicum]